jgi:hypothetical protein
MKCRLRSSSIRVPYIRVPFPVFRSHRISTAVAAFIRPAILAAARCTLQRYCPGPQGCFCLIVISSESFGLVGLVRSKRALGQKGSLHSVLQYYAVREQGAKGSGSWFLV